MAKHLLEIEPDSLAAMIYEAVHQLIQSDMEEGVISAHLTMDIAKDLVLSDPDADAERNMFKDNGLVSLKAFASTECPGVITVDGYLEAVTLPDYLLAEEMANRAGYEFWVDVRWIMVVDRAMKSKITAASVEERMSIISAMTAERFLVSMAPMVTDDPPKQLTCLRPELAPANDM